MEVSRAYAVANNLSPITVCSRVHDIMNERIQGAKSQDIKALNGLPVFDLLRDYFDTKERHGAGAPAEVEREDGDLKKRERVRERESWMRLRVGKSL